MRRVSLAVLIAVTLAHGARARDLTIGRATEPSSLDPQFALTGNNIATSLHIFDQLVAFDANLAIRPGLAAAWTLIDPETWEVAIRPRVAFQDGSPLTAGDVAFSLERIRHIANSPAPWTHAIGNVRSVEVTGPLSLRVHTNGPAPLLMEEIGAVFVVSEKAAKDATSADFNSGRATVGTGPYRFDSWARGDRLGMTANAAYWGGRPEFDHVTLRFLGSDAARMAALLTGDIDVADNVPPADVARLESNPDTRVFSTASVRLIYVGLDSERDVSPFVTDEAGAPMTRNPLRDARVRRAMSMMINRTALVERVVSGSGVPAGQIVPEGLGGHEPSLKPDALDVAGAKRLLAEAGYPKGFGLTLQTSTDRFPGDAAVGQAVGQMFARGGLRVNGVSALPYSVYASEATQRKYSAFVFSFGGFAGNSSEGLRAVLGTYDATKGTGALNRARYSNPIFDAALGQAAGMFDEGQRNAKLREATRIAYGDAAMLPLYWLKVNWATRKNLAYAPNKGESTTAMDTHIAK